MRLAPAVVTLCAALLLVACGGTSSAAPGTGATAVGAQAASGHPRLIVGEQDVERLRSWATPANPLYQQGLVPLVANAKRLMDRGIVPRQDSGAYGYEQYPTELYAELFAFMSIVAPEAGARADYGRRARMLLMYVIDRAAKGARTNAPFRDPMFSVGDRSRWQGEAFPLTVDWAYPFFSTADKRRIRTVFLRWAKEQYTGYPLEQITGPKPTLKGALNDPALTGDTNSLRWSLNNYFVAHARNLGLMSMALDAGDDPGAQLRSQRARVTGSWLFTIDAALRTQAQGLSPEGFEYGPDSFGRLAQLLVAMRTAGPDGDAAPVARTDGNPFWSELLHSYLTSLPPGPIPATGQRADLGPIWQAASFGDEESYWTLDPISLFGPMALDAAARGDADTVNAVRWIAANVPPGGPDQLLDRVSNTDGLFGSILYFLTFDPSAGPPTDPRPALDPRLFVPALNRTVARTCWCASARMFTHKLSFATIDHQVADGNDFGFLRNGEWLTKQRSGYDSQQTEALNIVTIGNDKPDHATQGTYPWDIWQRGGQWILTPSGDPTLVARSFGDGFVALTGDATKLYNSDYEHVTGVTHASRSIVWLEPDHIVVYDRATTTKAGRFKRFWLQTPAKPTISGRRATVATPKGQTLFTTTLLPEDAVLSATKNPKKLGTPAVGEPMGFRLRVQAPGGPQDVRFLHVLEGADGGASPGRAERVRSGAGTPYDGAIAGDQAVLFPVDLTGGPTTIGLTGGLRRILVTGLQPGAAYTAAVDSQGTLNVAEGGSTTADEGGVLVVTP
jgi:hypothetical protein